MALTAIQVKTAKAADKPQKLADGGGLYLLVQTTAQSIGGLIIASLTSAKHWQSGFIQT